MQNRKIKKLFWAGISLLALLFIFHNSMYPIVQSDQQSGAVLHALNRFLNASGFPAALTQFEVRKLAHIIEYFIFGCLFTGTVQMISEKPADLFSLELFLFLVFPVVDEAIQLNYPGRTSSVSDVLIDFVSCAAGTCICRMIFGGSKASKKNFGGLSGRSESVKDRSKRCVFTVITALFILFIFHNSMVSGPQSGSMSGYVTNLLNRALSVFSVPRQISDHFVRKAAHFAEYFLLGIFLRVTVRTYRKPVLKSAFTGMFLLLFVPVLDEFIQMFHVGRTSSILDVLLDFSGGAVGFLGCILTEK